MDESLRARFREMFEAAQAKRRRVEAELERRASDGPRAGDLYMFPGASMPWAILDGVSAGQRARFRVVPVDTSPLLGVADVEIPDDAACGPLGLRCGFVVRLDGEVLGSGKRVGYLEPAHVEAARAKVADLGRGDPCATSDQEETEFDPDYLDLTRRLARRARKLQRRSRAARISRGRARIATFVIRLSDFRPATNVELGDPPVEPPRARLSAQGAEDAAFEHAAAGGPRSLPVCTIQGSFAGALMLVDHGTSIGLHYVPAGAEEPPELRGEDPEGNPLELTWHRSPDGRGFLASPRLSWGVDPNVPIHLDLGERQRVRIERSISLPNQGSP